MLTHEFIDTIEKYLPCNVIYYPGTQQLCLFLNINNKPCTFCYDEEYINANCFEDIMCRIDDDMFYCANRGDK